MWRHRTKRSDFASTALLKATLWEEAMWCNRASHIPYRSVRLQVSALLIRTLKGAGAGWRSWVPATCDTWTEFQFSDCSLGQLCSLSVCLSLSPFSPSFLNKINKSFSNNCISYLYNVPNSKPLILYKCVRLRFHLPIKKNHIMCLHWMNLGQKVKQNETKLKILPKKWSLFFLSMSLRMVRGVFSDTLHVPRPENVSWGFLCLVIRKQWLKN